MSLTATLIDAAVPVASVSAAWITGKLAMKSDQKTRDATAAAQRNDVEALVYQRATATLQGLIDALQEEVGRWRDEADRLHRQLNQERTDNDTLRAQLRATEEQVQRLNRELTEARTLLSRLPADMAREIHGAQAQEGSTA